jgi:hypothetical protein
MPLPPRHGIKHIQNSHANSNSTTNLNSATHSHSTSFRTLIAQQSMEGKSAVVLASPELEIQAVLRWLIACHGPQDLEQHK